MSTLDKYPIDGTVTPGFEPVRTAFENNFHKSGEVGAALHVTLRGEPVVDLWGGSTKLDQTRAWNGDTLVNVWSTTKGWLALAMHMLADRGTLDFEKPVAHYWPEFAQKGKGKVLVRHLLTHTSGLPAPSIKVPNAALYDWQAMVRALEQSELFWESGTQTGYHAATFGWLNGEVLRRVTGVSVGEFIRTQIATPLKTDTFIHLTPDEQKRVADIIPPGAIGRWLFNTMNALRGNAAKLAFSNPPRPFKDVNTRRWREAEIPSSNGHASARGLARLYTPLALGGTFDEVRLLSEAAATRAGQEAFRGKDVIVGIHAHRTLGFWLPSPELGDPRPMSAFGHPGMGGSIGYADPEAQLAVGYVMNKMIIGLDTRRTAISKAIYACLDAMK